jgi:hypothetical protein
LPCFSGRDGARLKAVWMTPSFQVLFLVLFVRKAGKSAGTERSIRTSLEPQLELTSFQGDSLLTRSYAEFGGSTRRRSTYEIEVRELPSPVLHVALMRFNRAT